MPALNREVSAHKPETVQTALRPRNAGSLPELSVPDCSWRVAIVMLTFLRSPLLGAALRTWIPDAVWLRFDVLLMVSSPPREAANFTAQKSLAPRVSVRNAYHLLGVSDSRKLERWKVRAFYSSLVDPTAHDWFVMLDDDTLPNLPVLSRFLCALALRRRSEGLYVGFRPTDDKGEPQNFATGQFFLMDPAAMLALKGKMAALPRVRNREQCHSNATLSEMPLWWAGCCAVNDGTVTSFDLFIGACLSSTNVSLRVLPDRWWKRMFRHSAELKDPRTLTSLYEAWRTKLGIP